VLFTYHLILPRPSAFASEPPSAPPCGIPPVGASDRHSPGWYTARRREEGEAAERARHEPSRPRNADELIARFMNCAGTEWELAHDYLRNNGWGFEVALGEFWTAAYPESSDDEISSVGSDKGAPWVESEEEEGDGEEEEVKALVGESVKVISS